MKGFFTGIDGNVRGYATADAERRYTPAGEAVTTIEVGCGGTDKMKATFIRLVTFGKTAEVLAEKGKKGMAVIAFGSVNLKTWKKNDGSGYGFKLELNWIQELQVEVGGKFEVIEIEKKGRNRNGGKEDEVEQEKEEKVKK